MVQGLPTGKATSQTVARRSLLTAACAGLLASAGKSCEKARPPRLAVQDIEAMMNDELRIEDIQLGEGKAAVKGALITTQYRGFLEDGSSFDSSYERGKPFQCVIGTGRVIKGWDQGLMGMRVGGKRKLWVPAALAYGERGMGARVPANANLLFEIELLEVLTRDD